LAHTGSSPSVPAIHVLMRGNELPDEECPDANVNCRAQR
jgi:hypothetical protein